MQAFTLTASCISVFEWLLVSSTEHTHFQYTKSKINDIYLIEENSRKIISEIEQVIKNKKIVLYAI